MAALLVTAPGTKSNPYQPASPVKSEIKEGNYHENYCLDC